MLLNCTRKHLHLSPAPGRCSQSHGVNIVTLTCKKNGTKTTHWPCILQIFSVKTVHHQHKATLEDLSSMLAAKHAASQIARTFGFSKIRCYRPKGAICTFFSSFSVADGDTPRMSYSFVSATFAMSADRCGSCARRSGERGKPGARDVTCAPPRLSNARARSCATLTTIHITRFVLLFLNQKIHIFLFERQIKM